ncbi:hypothetical protein SEA_KENREY_236 [Streptomyces phage Kenrey]|nr:hypothetical protein SEA_KENREY_236 [Streptomyces phage Kenrey]
MKSTEGYKLALSKHAREQLIKKTGELGITRAQQAFETPDKVYPNKKYKGQFRIVGKGLCLIGRPTANGLFRVFTVYEDGVMTPPREDQMDTEEGRAYAELYRKAQVTGKVARNNEYYPRAKKRWDAPSDIRHTYIR